MIENERQLVALATALSGSRRGAGVAVPRSLVSTDTVRAARELIRAGDDPLGDLFTRLRSAEDRRARGATYTPSLIVKAMIDWAASEMVAPVRIIDPGAGSGRYLIAAAKAFPHAQLVASEIDPLATHLLRANASVRGFANRLTILAQDYRSISLPKVHGSTLFVGNPPYVRHHDISVRWKNWFARTAAEFGFKASKLAGLHIHFFLKTRALAQPGDFGAFITAAEWMDVNYGSLLRNLLADGLGGSAVHVIDPKAQPFADALTTGAITCFHVGKRPDQLTVRTVKSLVNLAPLSQGKAIDWAKIAGAPKWSVFIHGPKHREAGRIELGEVFAVHRGQATGNNNFWIENAAMVGMPDRYLFPTVMRARELIDSGGTLHSLGALRRVLDLPRDLSVLSEDERHVIKRFLRLGVKQGVPSGYIAAHRPAWWAVGLRNPAPILCTYMARSAPTFVHNLAGARHLNIAHGLHPREPLSEPILMAILTWLRGHVGTAGGRVYAGGLIKFEPKELERILIPAIDDIHGLVAEEVDRTRTRRRRRNCDGRLSLRALG